MLSHCTLTTAMWSYLIYPYICSFFCTLLKLLNVKVHVSVIAKLKLIFSVILPVGKIEMNQIRSSTHIPHQNTGFPFWRWFFSFPTVTLCFAHGRLLWFHLHAVFKELDLWSDLKLSCIMIGSIWKKMLWITFYLSAINSIVFVVIVICCHWFLKVVSNSCKHSG